MSRWRRRPERPWVLGHRGASAHATENTLAAFARARADGADGVELDVVPCASGEALVFHDDDLRRLAGRPERICDLGFPALRDLRLTGGEAIPTLDEVMEVLGDLMVNVELKAPVGPAGLSLARTMAAHIGRAAWREQVLVSSFNPIALGLFRALAPSVPTGLLFHPDQARPLREGWARHVLRPQAVHPEHTQIDPGTIARWRSEGYLVNTWTVDDAAELRRLAALGVDAVICNDPGAALAAL